MKITIISFALFLIVDDRIKFSQDNKIHRDGIAYKYEPDPDLNVIEKIDRRSS